MDWDDIEEGSEPEEAVPTKVQVVADKVADKGEEIWAESRKGVAR